MEEFALEHGEKVMKRVRKHVLVIIVPFICLFLIALFPLAIPMVVEITGTDTAGAADALSALITFDNPWVRFALGVWWLALWLAAMNIFTRWFLSLWIITNTRVVDIHQQGLFNRRVSSTLLARVQDVTTDVNGFFNTILGFGTLKVQTAGAEEELVMDNIVGPEHLRDFIMKEIAALHSSKSL